MAPNKRWDRNGPDAATIVKEYIAGRAKKKKFKNWIEGRKEWLDLYKYDTLKRNFCSTVKRYKKWKLGGKFLEDFCLLLLLLLCLMQLTLHSL